MGALNNRGMAFPAIIFWLCIIGGLGFLIMDIVKGKDAYDGKSRRGRDKYVSSSTTTSKGGVFQEIGENLGLVKEAKWWSSPAKVKREEITQVFVGYSSAKTKRKQQSGVASYYVDQQK